MQPKLLDLTLEVIQRCLNSCLFCSSLAGMHSQHQLGLDEILHVANQAVSLGLLTIGVSGGEPLLHPNINLMIQALNKDLQVRLYTTGICFGPTGKPTHFTDWSAFDPLKTKIIFNVQSTEPWVHDRLTRRQGSLELTCRAMLSAKRGGFHVEAHLVPNRLNLSTLESSVEDLANWGVDQISFLRLVPQGNAEAHASQLLLNREESVKLKRIFQRLGQMDWQGTKLRFGIPFTGLFDDNASCNAALSKLIVRYDGVVLPCEAFKCAPDASFQLGNIRNHSLCELLTRGQTLCNLNALKIEAKSFHESCPAQIFWARNSNRFPCCA